MYRLILLVFIIYSFSCTCLSSKVCRKCDPNFIDQLKSDFSAPISNTNSNATFTNWFECNLLNQTRWFECLSYWLLIKNGIAPLVLHPFTVEKFVNSIIFSTSKTFKSCTGKDQIWYFWGFSPVGSRNKTIKIWMKRESEYSKISIVPQIRNVNMHSPLQYAKILIRLVYVMWKRCCFNYDEHFVRKYYW